VSRQLSALEASLGGALTLRTTRKLTVTEAGRRYYEKCLRILREVDGAQSTVKSGQAMDGLLVVTVPVTLGLQRIAPHLPSLLAAHRGLRIDIRFEDRVVDLVSEGVDVAIRAGSALPDTTSIVAHKLTAYRRLIVASPRYVKRCGDPKTPRALAGHNAIVHLGATAAPGTWRFVQNGEEVAVAVTGTVRTNALYAIREAVIAGQGIALLPEYLIEDDLAAGRLRVLLGDWDAGSNKVYALHRAELRSSQRVRVFVEHVTRALARTSTAERGRRAASRRR
jgi:DNA-binding transcriptional LysR family regulator